MIAIYKKEMRTYFTQMMGYVFLAFLLLLVGIWFVMINVFGGNANFHNVLGQVVIFFFILLPILTMRLFSEEIRQKTDQLIFTSPLTVAGIVLGKFFAAFSLFVIGTLLTAVLPMILSRYAELPLSQIVGTYIGFIMLGASCIAVGVFISCLTENQIIAAVATMGAIFAMFLIDAIALTMPTSTFASLMFVAFIIAAVVAVWYNSTRHVIASIIVGVAGIAVAVGLYFFNNLIFEGLIVRVLLWFSVFSRYNNFTRGVLNLNDLVYYVSFAALFLYITVNILEKRRWR